MSGKRIVEAEKDRSLEQAAQSEYLRLRDCHVKTLTIAARITDVYEKRAAEIEIDKSFALVRKAAIKHLATWIGAEIRKIALEGSKS